MSKEELVNIFPGVALIKTKVTNSTNTAQYHYDFRGELVLIKPGETVEILKLKPLYDISDEDIAEFVGDENEEEEFEDGCIEDNPTDPNSGGSGESSNS
jgi:hypothetical protein